MAGYTMVKVGVWAFTIGILIALLAAFVPASMGLGTAVTTALILLGLVVGFLNVTEKETKSFLMSSVAMLIALFTAGTTMQANIASMGAVGTYLWGIISNIQMFVFPATIIVAIKAIYALAKD